VLLDRLSDVLTFKQTADDRYLADFGEKFSTLAERLSDDRVFDNPELGDDAPAIYGGYSLALALVVSGSTVGEDLVPLSAHSVFLRAGLPTEAVEISVEHDQDSRRFARRRVRFAQGDRVFFSSDVCLHRPDPDGGWQQSPIDMPAPAEMSSSKVSIVPVTEERPLAGPESNPFEDVVFPKWIRFPAGVPASPSWGAAAQAWASDSFVAQSMLLASGRSSDRFGARTLEHSMWFHRPVDPADWLLLDMTPTSLTDQRYLATGSIHNEIGVLGATIVQAGIFLPNPTV